MRAPVLYALSLAAIFVSGCDIASQGDPADGNSKVAFRSPLFSYSPEKELLVWTSAPGLEATWLRVDGSPDAAPAQEKRSPGSLLYKHEGESVLADADSQGEPGNVLQLGEDLPKSGPAPITVRKLNGKMVDARVSPTEAYTSLNSWHRDVEWNANTLEVKDSVEFKLGKREPINFHWNIATSKRVEIKEADTSALIRWADVEMAVSADAPILVSQELGTTDRSAAPESNRITITALENDARFRLITRIRSLPEQATQVTAGGD